MHTIVIRNDVLEESPWVAQTIYKGLDQARARCPSQRKSNLQVGAGGWGVSSFDLKAAAIHKEASRLPCYKTL